VTAKDLFPPSAPEGLIVTLIPAQAATANAVAASSYLDLSWAIAPEHDVVGYNVYRSEGAGDRGVKQNPELLPTPAFRDMNGVPGHVYFYSVTAVDRAGNESAPSAPVQGSLSEDAPPASQNP
jgi:fibronectin type 3 domain-containing protein